MASRFGACFMMGNMTVRMKNGALRAPPLWLRLIIGHRPLTPAVADQILDHAWPILATDPTSTVTRRQATR